MTTTSKLKDTPKVNRSSILLGYQVRRPKVTIDPQTRQRSRTGYVTIRGSVLLYYSAKVIEWFNIPTYDGSATGSSTAANLALSNVRAGTRSFYSSVIDTSASQVPYDEFKRLIGQSTKRPRVYSVQVPLGGGRVTPKGRPRLLSMPFPNFFNHIMIAQALGQMLGSASEARRPGYFVSPAGVRYGLVYAGAVTQDSPVQGSSCGAWVATSFIAPTNLDNVDNIPSGNISIVSSAGDGDGNG